MTADLIQRLRFLASGQDDVRSMALDEAANALEAMAERQAPAEGDEALAERLRDAYHSKTRIGHPMWKNLDTDRKEPWLAVARAARPNVQPKGPVLSAKEWTARQGVVWSDERMAGWDACVAQSTTQAPAPAHEVASAPRPFDAVKSFADSVLAMLDERIKTADRATHPFNDYFGDKPETIVAAKAQASELREVRTQVRILGDRALVDLMKFRPAISSPAVEPGAPAKASTPLIIDVLARWEDQNGSLACVLASEWDALRQEVMDAAVIESPRMARNRLEALAAQPHTAALAARSATAIACLPDAPYKVALQKLHDDMLAAIAAQSQAAPVAQWQPIETAPKDGTEILGHEPRIGALVIYWLDDRWTDGMSRFERKPTLWMPILPVPASLPPVQGSEP